MFGLKFGKKVCEMDEGAATAFWQWFVESEKWIVECLENSDAQFVYEVDKHLKPVFPYVRRELEFQLGYEDGKGELFLFHFGDDALERDGERLKRLMPAELASRWEFILDI